MKSSSSTSSASGVAAYPAFSPLATHADALGGRPDAFARDFDAASQISRHQSEIRMMTTGSLPSPFQMHAPPGPRGGIVGIAGMATIDMPSPDDDVPEVFGDDIVDWGLAPDLGPPPVASVAKIFRLDEAKREPVPSIISYIWIGGNGISGANYNNLLHAARLNPHATVHLYLDSETRDISLEALAVRSGFDAGCALRQCPNVKLVRVRDSAFGEAFSNAHGDAYAFYERCMAAGKFAMASDTLRYEAVYRTGGAYFDADDELLTPIDFQRLNAAPDEVLHQTPYALEHIHGDGLFFPNCPFAARAGCELLREVIDRCGANYQRYVRMENGGYKPQFRLEDAIPYYEINRMCGPGVFTEVLVEHDPRSALLYQLHANPAKSSDALPAGIERHVPFAKHDVSACAFRSGSDHSWDTTKGVPPFERLAVREPEGLPQPNADGIRIDERGNGFVRAGGFTFRVALEGTDNLRCVLTPHGRASFVTVQRSERGIWCVQDNSRPSTPNA
ncbi:glycosyltransferase [Pandoraea apista]|uniref:Insecticidal toxin n=1 Tax=Pandoraea apista TaxID=93218 RepID=A0ABX9ZU80_9BURK|nr:glycosyltransferase [Pandoraea apista]PTE02436.1 hypothetical protein C7830_03315 [Pandoraea apista]RRJ33366.1 hypothetical protein EIB05_06415 [Pandoraea apista]RRJ82064.1 hypothetical protein EIL82_01000 [Pandoraea apista]RSD15722.1 hypothetical protein EJB12_07360 [Pandoraea apista]RSK85196.1 hypothetical protein EJE83_04150 [Pandoraea apista]